MCCWWCCSLNDDWCSRRKGCSLESLEVLFVCKERWWKVCSSLACSGPRWMLMRRGVFEWEKFDVVKRGEKLACWQMACSTCADVFVHVDQVALDPVCKLSGVALERVVWTFWLIRPEVSSMKSWWCRACSVVAVDVVGETVAASVKRWNCVELLTWGWDDIPLTLLMLVPSSRCDARCWLPNRCLSNSLVVLIDVPWLKAARDEKRTLSVKLLRWGDWNLSWGWGRSHVRFLVVAVPSQSLVVHLPIAERLHHLMTKPDCCLFFVGAALLQVLRLSCTWKLMMRVLLDHRFDDETWL